MNAAWTTAPTLADTEDVGYFRLATPSGSAAYFRVRWNRAHTGRYAEQVLIGADRAKFHYTPGMLPGLTPQDRITEAQLLKWLADRGPYSQCLFCGRELYEAPYITFGVGPKCAEEHLSASARLVTTLHRALVNSSDRGGAPATPPRTQRGHLRLVAVDGRRIA